MKTIAIIPARGGSKRIPNKNIRSFNGKPMIAHAIETAKSTGLFDEIIVSTDSALIAEIAKQYGASVPFLRPAALSDDYTGTGAVIKHAITWLEERQYVFDRVCCIYPTCPLLTAALLKQGYERLSESPHLNFTFSVGFYRYPVLRALKLNEHGGVEMLFPQNVSARSQDLASIFHDAGQFYWGKTQAWKEGRPMFSDHTGIVELPPYRVIDIDTEDDWKIAELYAALVHERKFD
ncbi:MAG: pseudaminic acid cytidylyltransferase [Hahellaceae bacterium]|nr:pseudaminic acid cytidylyltransferase [Hahellaceae bacterium]